MKNSFMSFFSNSQQHKRRSSIYQLSPRTKRAHRFRWLMLEQLEKRQLFSVDLSYREFHSDVSPVTIESSLFDDKLVLIELFIDDNGDVQQKRIEYPSPSFVSLPLGVLPSDSTRSVPSPSPYAPTSTSNVLAGNGLAEQLPVRVPDPVPTTKVDSVLSKAKPPASEVTKLTDESISSSLTYLIGSEVPDHAQHPMESFRVENAINYLSIRKPESSIVWSIDGEGMRFSNRGKHDLPGQSFSKPNSILGESFSADGIFGQAKSKGETSRFAEAIRPQVPGSANSTQALDQLLNRLSLISPQQNIEPRRFDWDVRFNRQPIARISIDDLESCNADANRIPRNDHNQALVPDSLPFQVFKSSDGLISFRRIPLKHWQTFAGSHASEAGGLFPGPVLLDQSTLPESPSRISGSELGLREGKTISKALVNLGIVSIGIAVLWNCWESIPVGVRTIAKVWYRRFTTRKAAARRRLKSWRSIWPLDD